MGQKSENKKEPSPFREELQPISSERDMSGHESKFRTLPNLGGKLIRREGIQERLEPGRERFGRIHFEDYVKAREIFGDLKSRYGIAVPEIKLVALVKKTSEITNEEDVGKGVMFTVIDDIEGKNLEKLDCLPQEAVPQFESFFEHLIQYIIDSCVEKKPFLWDIYRATQYVYGRKKGDGDNKIYLVDVDPRIVYPDSKMYGKEAVLFLESMWTFIEDIEQKFSSPASFSEARKKLEEAIARVAAMA